MKILHQLRWKLTLSYMIVTVSAFLVVLLILGGVVLNRIFIPKNFLNFEQVIEEVMNSEYYKLVCHILSLSPVDTKMVNQLVSESGATITNSEIMRIGAIRLWITTNAWVRLVIVGTDGTLLGTSESGAYKFNATIGSYFDPKRIPGLEGPFNAALAGKTDPKDLYTVVVPNQQYVIAIPAFNQDVEDKNQVIGVVVFLLDSFPTRQDIPVQILNIAGRSLIFFVVGTAIMGAIFGAFFSKGMTKRFRSISETTDLWSAGDFSRYIDDNSGDEISQFGGHLNDMAKQLQSLLRRRQEMAVSEERNRLARDLHDSAKQQALAASLELGTAITLYEREPQEAKKHLEAADTLVDAVRKELTNLVHELRPQALVGEDFSDILREYATEWAQRSGIELSFAIEGESNLPLEIRESLFRIAQEALANVARHSYANSVALSLEQGINSVTMVVKDNGRGFDPNVSHTGVGLASMRERAERLGGSLSVESTPGQGTKIVVNLPAKG